MAAWMQTYTGKKFYPTEPRTQDICLEDIAHGLSMICRYGGHTRAFYSVAQHSVLASKIITPGFELWGLLHDAAETYIGDVVRPIKGQLWFCMREDLKTLERFKEVEENILKRVAKAFNLSWPPPHEVIEAADTVLLVTERRDLMTPTEHRWDERIEATKPLDGVIIPQTWQEAKASFLRRYKELTGGPT